MRAVADAFDRRENEEQDRAGRNDVGVGLHFGLQRFDADAIEGVDFVVAFDDRHRYVGIAFAVRAHRIGEHRLGNGRDLTDFDRRGAHGDVDQLDRVLRNIDGVVADALEIGDDLQGAGDGAQFACDRLLFPDQLDARGFDTAPRVVDLVVAGDHARGEGAVAALESVGGRPDRIEGQGAETYDIEPSIVQCLVVSGAHLKTITCADARGAPLMHSYERGPFPQPENAPAMAETLLVERDGAVAILTLNRPAVLNALNADLLEQLRETLDQLKGDKAVRAVVITGSGERAFAAGADIAELAALEGAAAGEAKARAGQHVTELIEALPVPVIAAVNGFALGGGCELAMACDFRLASDNAKFGQPEVNLGLPPGYGGTQRTTRLLGSGMALYLCLTGEMIDAAEALRIGLVQKVVPIGELVPEAKRIANLIATKGPLAVAATKRAIYGGAALSMSDALKLEAHAFGAMFDTSDMREGTSAFLEKRKPQFRGA